VCRGDQLQQALLARGGDPFQVAFQQRREGLGGLPFGMLRRERFDAISQIESLDVDRLLRPERAVVVEDGDALRNGNKLGRAFRRRRRDEFDDGLLRRRVVPGRERVGGVEARRKQRDDYYGEDLQHG
jgi:hypothetical protein